MAQMEGYINGDEHPRTAEMVAGSEARLGIPLIRIGAGATVGLSVYRNIDVHETGAVVKGSAGLVYGWFVHNAAAATRWVRIYNHVDAPAGGDGADIVLSFGIPAGSSANSFSPIGIVFSAGIGVRATTGVADADVGAPAANDVVLNLYYV